MTTAALAEARGRPRLPVVLLAFGPGLMVMLADTDAGSIVTAAQSGPAGATGSSSCSSCSFRSCTW